MSRESLFGLFLLCTMVGPMVSIVVKPSEKEENSAVEKSDEQQQPTMEPRASTKKEDYISGDYGGYYDNHHHYDHHHVGHHHGYNDAALKGLLVPLAGVALLGAAAIFASNPILLQLGVISGKKRRRRDAAVESLFQAKIQDMETLEKFIDQLPRDQVLKQEQKLLASYLQCSEINNNENRCLERLSCEIQRPGANVTHLEKHVLSIVTSDIMKNEFIPEELKFRVHAAKNVGLRLGDCSKFHCSQVEI